MRAGNLLVFSIVAIVAATLLPDMAFAYVGPGAGISLLGALWGLIVGVFLAVGMVVFWPIRILIRKFKHKDSTAEQTAAEPANHNGAKPPSPQQPHQPDKS